MRHIILFKTRAPYANMVALGPIMMALGRAKRVGASGSPQAERCFGRAARLRILLAGAFTLLICMTVINQVGTGASRSIFAPQPRRCRRRGISFKLSGACT